MRRRSDPAEDPDFRPPFFRDADRIIHSHAYARYIDKTQVFFQIENDHITHRALHVQLVAKVGRTIGRALGLNEDLIEACALGHDIGHVPYGHVGETMLKELCLRHGIGEFHHNVQSVHCLDIIENCNLTLQTLDGILSHDGERIDQRLIPEPIDTWDAITEKIGRAQRGSPVTPGTLEGCVVRFADSIAYLGRDLEDAIEVHFLDDVDDLPEPCREVFGIQGKAGIGRAVLDVTIKDLVNESFGLPYIGYSDEVAEALSLFKKFNYERIYLHERLVNEREKIRSLFADLFEHYLHDVEMNGPRSMIYQDFLNAPWVSPTYRDNISPAMAVRDYIAGMTDRYFNAAVNATKGVSRDQPNVAI